MIVTADYDDKFGPWLNIGDIVGVSLFQGEKVVYGVDKRGKKGLIPTANLKVNFP